MAHRNIDKRRAFVYANFDNMEKSVLISIASKRFKCSKSAISSDITALVHDRLNINKTIYPSPGLKKKIYERDNGICQYCGFKDDGSRTFVIDHVKPASLGGCAKKSNLVLACQSCNTKKKIKKSEVKALIKSKPSRNSRTIKHPAIKIDLSRNA